jgi:hypothetical protein
MCWRLWPSEAVDERNHCCYHRVTIEEPNDAAELMADPFEEPPEKRVAIMQAALEAQRAALLKLAVIIKQRVNQDEQLANIARQSEASAATSRLAVQWATNIRGADTQAPHVTSIAAKPEAGDGDLHSDLSSANGETPDEMLSPSMRLAMIIKAGPSLALMLAVALRRPYRYKRDRGRRIR